MIFIQWLPTLCYNICKYIQKKNLWSRKLAKSKNLKHWKILKNMWHLKILWGKTIPLFYSQYSLYKHFCLKSKPINHRKLSQYCSRSLPIKNLRHSAKISKTIKYHEKKSLRHGHSLFNSPQFDAKHLFLSQVVFVGWWLSITYYFYESLY